MNAFGYHLLKFETDSMREVWHPAVNDKPVAIIHKRGCNRWQVEGSGLLDDSLVEAFFRAILTHRGAKL